MPGFPDYVINDISIPVAMELLDLLEGQNCSYELVQWKENLAGEVDLAWDHVVLDALRHMTDGVGE